MISIAAVALCAWSAPPQPALRACPRGAATMQLDSDSLERLRQAEQRIDQALRGRDRPIVGRLRRRLRRRKDAKVLGEYLSAKETLYLSREVSLQSTATEILSEAVRDLGKSASDTEGDASGRGWDVRLEEAWRRDAMRALLSLQRAPDQLLRELKRQRLGRLSAELRVLGLQGARWEALTEADVRAARAAKAKALHPDLAFARGAAEPAPRGWLGGLFGAREASSTEDVDDAPSDAHAKMAELNAAHDAVREAVVAAPVYDIVSAALSARGT